MKQSHERLPRCYVQDNQMTSMNYRLCFAEIENAKYPRRAPGILHLSSHLLDDQGC